MVNLIVTVSTCRSAFLHVENIDPSSAEYPPTGHLLCRSYPYDGDVGVEIYRHIIELGFWTPTSDACDGRAADLGPERLGARFTETPNQPTFCFRCFVKVGIKNSKGYWLKYEVPGCPSISIWMYPCAYVAIATTVLSESLYSINGRFTHCLHSEPPRLLLRVVIPTMFLVSPMCRQLASPSEIRSATWPPLPRRRN